ncbi:MAG: UDP-N-acetylmuramoyl-L-alanyl-D-glutamate--2,6-diaminopimelate ligase [Patescibacteria group bacterium]
MKNLWHWGTSWVYALIYGLPAYRLTVVGVTGTDGKTTTSHLIYEMLKTAGFKVALISTVAAYIGDDEIDTGFHVTTPDARLLQPLLKRIADRGITHVVLEVTSHGLDQNRLAGVRFMVGIITNISHEHLDYHGTFEKYKAAKMKLLRMAKHPIYRYTKYKFKILNPKLAGEYNKYNAGAAETVAKVFGIQYSVISEVVKNFAGVPGRMEEIKLGQKFRAIVDFAHTPNALDKILSELRNQVTKGHKLIVVFGCAGLRDHTKRPMMGKIAAKLADKIIITAEDPRTETLESIYRDITAVGSIREDDRQKAINMAVKMAKPGDIVVVTGKGHEKSMCFGKTEYPWSDKEAFTKAIKKL